jgi:hypothetical protein
MKKLNKFLLLFILASVGYFLLSRLWDYICGDLNTTPIYKDLFVALFCGLGIAITNTYFSKKS